MDKSLPFEMVQWQILYLFLRV